MPNAYTRPNQTVQTHELATRRPRLEASSQPCPSRLGLWATGTRQLSWTPGLYGVPQHRFPSGSNDMSCEEIKPMQPIECHWDVATRGESTVRSESPYCRQRRGQIASWMRCCGWIFHVLGDSMSTPAWQASMCCADAWKLYTPRY